MLIKRLLHRLVEQLNKTFTKKEVSNKTQLPSWEEFWDMFSMALIAEQPDIESELLNMPSKGSAMYAIKSALELTYKAVMLRNSNG